MSNHSIAIFGMPVRVTYRRWWLMLQLGIAIEWSPNRSVLVSLKNFIVFYWIIFSQTAYRLVENSIETSTTHTYSCHPYRPLKQVQPMLSRSRNPFVLADMYLLQSLEGSTHPRRWVVSGYLSCTLANWNRRDLLHWDPACLRNGSHSLSVLDRWKRSSGGRLHEAIFNQNSFVSM